VRKRSQSPMQPRQRHRSLFRVTLRLVSLLVLLGGITIAILWHFPASPCTKFNEGSCANSTIGIRVLIGLGGGVVALILYWLSGLGEPRADPGLRSQA
jgi:hypothetical protein